MNDIELTAAIDTLDEVLNKIPVGGTNARAVGRTIGLLRTLRTVDFDDDDECGHGRCSSRDVDDEHFVYVCDDCGQEFGPMEWHRTTCPLCDVELAGETTPILATVLVWHVVDHHEADITGTSAGDDHVALISGQRRKATT